MEGKERIWARFGNIVETHTITADHCHRRGNTQTVATTVLNDELKNRSLWESIFSTRKRKALLAKSAASATGR